MKRLLKVLLIAGGLLVVLVAAALFFLPQFIDAEAQRSVLLSRLEGVLGRKVKLGAIHLSLLPPALVVENAEIADALGFGNAAFSTASKLKARVSLFPLLSGKLEIASIQVEDPVIHLVRNERGQWNFSSLGQAKPAAGTKGGAAPAAPPAIEIGEMTVRNATLSVVDKGRKGLSATYDQVDLTLRNFSTSANAGRPFDFQVSAHLPGSGKGLASAEGQGGPLNFNNLAASPAKGNAHFEEVDLRSLAAFTDQPGLGGLFSGDTTFSSDGHTAPVEGTYRVDRLRVSPKGSPALAPVTGKYKVEYKSETERLELKEVELATGKSAMHMGGRLDFSKPAGSELTVRASNASLPDVGKLLPALGVKLPAGSSLAAGTLSLNTMLRGPFQHLNGKTTVDILNARLAGYSLGNQLSLVAKLAGVPTGPDTVIDKMHANMTFVNGTINTDDMQMVAPGMTVAGAGSISEPGEMNLKMTATLTKSSSVTSVLQKVTGGSNTVPFFLKGTFEHPTVIPDVARMAQQQVGDRTTGLGKTLGGLFGKKKN